MAEPGPSRLLLVILVVIAIVGAGVGVWGANYLLHPKSQASILTVAVGDNVTVNYIGSFGSGGEIGRTFDTSIFSVYQNNVTYPKSLYFPSTHGGNPANYTPLPTHIGPSGQYTIGNLTFGTTVAGFWQGLVGMNGNQTRYVVIPYSLGYGPLDPACTATRPLAYTVPVYVTVPADQFSAVYPGISATSGTTFTDPTYGWTDLILSVNATAVVVNHLPSLGQTTRFDAWNITVTNLSSTTISVLNLLTPSNYGRVLGTFSAAQSCGGQSQAHYLISGVNLNAGTYSINWNSEVTGQTLIFRVTIVDIFKG
ncbi:MAG: FKBP-type peptidyl-prolyl cis-trans isomerase [Thermoplasmata archaeon]|nr:FKBP-type peptidyl-prolyl cis-trans isomerase [Thermoplasmata archaeon]